MIATARAHRLAFGANAGAFKFSGRFLDAAVFYGMVAHHHQTTAHLEAVYGSAQAIFDFLEFAVHFHANRLEHAGQKAIHFAAFVGEMAYYACGLIYYYIMFNFVLTNGMTIGVRELFLVWFLSTVIPDFVLCVLAASLACRLIPLLDLSGMQ